MSIDLSEPSRPGAAEGDGRPGTDSRIADGTSADGELSLIKADSGDLTERAPTIQRESVTVSEPEAADSRVRAGFQLLSAPGPAFLVGDAVAVAGLAILATDRLAATAVLGAILVAAAATGGQYRRALTISMLDDLPLMMRGAATLLLASLLLQYAVDHATVMAAVLLALQGLVRAVLYPLVRRSRRRTSSRAAALVVGSGAVSHSLVSELDEHPGYGLRVIGYVDAIPGPHGDPTPGWRYLGTPDTVGDLVRRQRVEVLIIGYGYCRDSQISDLLRDSELRRRTVLVVPRLFEVGRRARVSDHVGAVPLCRPRMTTHSGPRRAAKRALDVVLSGVALVLLTPVLLAVAVAVRLEGGPGVLFRQQRVGRDGREFELLKFRSMRPLDHVENQERWTIAGDPRVGRVGAFLRRTSLDELPQLVNILRGDMSIVGPRPERPHFVQQFTSAHAHYRHRHRADVGLTGLAQVNGLRGDTSISRRALFDNYYIENWSLWLDIKVIARTLNEVVAARGR